MNDFKQVCHGVSNLSLKNINWNHNILGWSPGNSDHNRTIKPSPSHWFCRGFQNEASLSATLKGWQKHLLLRCFAAFPHIFHHTTTIWAVPRPTFWLMFWAKESCAWHHLSTRVWGHTWEDNMKEVDLVLWLGQEFKAACSCWELLEYSGCKYKFKGSLENQACSRFLGCLTPPIARFYIQEVLDCDSTTSAPWRHISTPHLVRKNSINCNQSSTVNHQLSHHQQNAISLTNKKFQQEQSTLQR